MHKTIIVPILWIALLTGCIPWDAKENRQTRYSLLKKQKSVHFTVLWTHKVGSGSNGFYSYLHPAWSRSVIFAADRYGLIQALSAKTGKIIWSKDLSVHKSGVFRSFSAKLFSGITVEGNKIYVGSELAIIYALNAINGDIVWKTTVAGEVLSTPIVSNDKVLVHTGNGILQAINKNNGMIQWSIGFYTPPLTLRGESSPVITKSGVIIIGDDNGYVNAVTLKKGQLIWQRNISQINDTTTISGMNDIKTAPIVINDTAYATAYNGNLTAINVHSGKVLWFRKIGSISNFVIKKKKIYIVSQYNQIISIDREKGTILWCQKNLLHKNLTPLSLYKDNLIIGDAEGYIYCIDSNNGQIIAKQRLDHSGFLAEPIVAEDKLIVQAKNGSIYAIIT